MTMRPEERREKSDLAARAGSRPRARLLPGTGKQWPGREATRLSAWKLRRLKEGTLSASEAREDRTQMETGPLDSAAGLLVTLGAGSWWSCGDQGQVQGERVVRMWLGHGKAWSD